MIDWADLVASAVAGGADKGPVEPVPAAPLEHGPDSSRYAVPGGSGRKDARSCESCRHVRRPGLADGYCDGRGDLPPAYGAGHPLHLLPDDRGVSCDRWKDQ